MDDTLSASIPQAREGKPMSRVALMPDPPEQSDPRARTYIPEQIMDGEYGGAPELTEYDLEHLEPIDYSHLYRECDDN